MPSYGPWTWSPPHSRYYSYYLADDGVTVIQTTWADSAASNLAQSTTAAQNPVNNASTPRTGVDLPVAFSQHQASIASSSSQGTSIVTPPLTSAYAPQSYGPTPSSGLLQSTESAYGTGRADANSYGQQQFGQVSGIDGLRNETSGGTNYTTVPYGLPSPQSYPSAQASTTTASAGSPYPQNSYQEHTSYPFNSSPPNPSQQIMSGWATGQSSGHPGPRRAVTSLPADVQSTIQSLDRRYIQTNINETSEHERLDIRYRRVAQPSRATFFVLGRVFKMLWTEPAGQTNPGKTRNSTHFSTVQYGEQAFSEIRRFIVVRNKGDFSQCIPIQTYKGQGATKRGLVMSDHGVIHTTLAAPSLLPGEQLTKFSIRVQPANGEYLEPASRVNYGKAYAVEHNVKVLDVGMVLEDHRYLIKEYFDSAMRGQ